MIRTLKTYLNQLNLQDNQRTSANVEQQMIDDMSCRGPCDWHSFKSVQIVTTILQATVLDGETFGDKET
jgi:hypothetical protein